MMPKQMLIPKGFYLKDTIHGLGLFADVRIKKNQCVAVEENYYLDTLQNVSKYAIEVSRGVFLDYHTENYLNYVNHACDPNMIYNISELSFFSICNIPPDTELTYNYNTTQSDMIKENTWFNCNCSYKYCKGMILGYNFK